MNKVSVIIPTLGRESLYPLVDDLLKQKVNFGFEIILIPQVPLKENLLKNKKIKIHYASPGKGFAYYRNTGIKLSKSEIIVFIDDDELPMNSSWLRQITEPVISGNEDVVTSGCDIKLNQGYLTNSVSLLGFPGGGAIGFETMWPLKNPPYTDHLCSGNLAITKKILSRVKNFSNEMKNGNEDVNLAEKLVENNINIFYQKNATVYHVARKGFFNFIKWNIMRGKSAAEFLKQKKNSGKVGGRLSSSKRILTKTIKTRYFIGVLFMMLNQYIWQTGGYLWKKLKS
jgi:glycosyltransferase involved in cell wall biosynthesis